MMGLEKILVMFVFFTAGDINRRVKATGTYFLQFSRAPSITGNEVTLDCLVTTNNGNFRGSVVFFRNEIPLSGSSGNSHFFIVNRRNEGNYSCGERVGNTILRDNIPNTVPILPYPNNENFQPKQFSFNVGSQAVMNCTLQPGVMVSSYSVLWRNASDLSQVFFENSRFRRQTLDSRYSLNDKTFALMIDNVQPSDTRSPYVCEVSVFIAGEDRPFPNTATTNQTLSVFEAPAFITSPLGETVPNEGKNATFNCAVRSSPGPSTITWFHKTSTRGETQITQTMSRYLVELNMIPTVGGYQISSKLMVVGVRGSDMGEIICEARYSEVNDIMPSRQNASLTVISAPTDLEGRFLEDGDILYEVFLPGELLVPVQVALFFINAETGAKHRSLRPDEYFFNASTLRLFRNQAPFGMTRFKVNVGLVFGNNEVQGPLLAKDRIFGEEEQPKELNMEFIICAAIFSSFTLILLVFLIVLCAMVLILQRNHSVMRYTEETSIEKVPKGRCRGRLAGPTREANGIEGDGANKRGCFANLQCRTKDKYCSDRGLSENKATIYIKNLKRIIAFGLKDATLKRKLDKSKREELWPLHTDLEMQEYCL